LLALSSSQFDPTETLPIDYCALRGPDLYAILCEDRRALCLARAEEDDKYCAVDRCASTTPLLGAARVCDDLREAFRAKAYQFLALF
jgi:hypothetical protein